jgi:hypothetical protein
MPNIKLYNYQTGKVPEGTKWVKYWAAPDNQVHGLTTTIAPWLDEPMLCAFYDANDKLIGVRFIRRDGTYEDQDISNRKKS